MSPADTPSLLTDAQLRPYLDDVRLWHGYVRFLGLPTMIDNPDTPMNVLFVTPLLHEQAVTPESDPAGWPKGQSLLAALERPKRLVILGDPGCGKSTHINWLAWMLAGGEKEVTVPSLVASLPLPLVARDLKLDGVRSFDALIDAFLERPVAAHLKPQREQLFERLASGRVCVLVDGLDEVAPVLRQSLRDALREGVERYPEAVFVVTSRVVGYDEQPLNLPPSTLNAIQQLIEHGESDGNFGSKGLDFLRSRLHDQASMSSLWQSLYVMPFDDARIAAFATRWYSMRAVGEVAGQDAGKFIAAVRANPSIQALARMPQLLTLMALVHRISAKLPDGRAILYDQIVEAYLRSIDSARGLSSSADESTWHEKRLWLARVGFEMQLLRWRSTQERAESGDQGRDLLAPKAEVLDWVSQAMAHSAYPSKVSDANKYLDWVARRSGLLLPRGEGFFAFVHLSFQEYFAALYLREHLADADWIMAQRDAHIFPEGDPRVTTEAISQWAKSAVWQEVFVFAAETFANHPRDARRLANLLFGDEFSDLSESIERIAAPIAMSKNANNYEAPRMELLTRLVINPHSGWSVSLREGGRDLIFEYTKSAEQTFSTLEFPNPGVGSVVSRRIFEHEATAKNYLDWIVKQEPLCLNLVGIGKISSRQLRPLDKLIHLLVQELDDQNLVGLAQNFPSLRRLYVSRAAALTSLLGAEHLGDLEILFIPHSNIRDIEPIGELVKLVYLNIAGAPVERIDALSNKSNLRILDISLTKVSSIEPIRACKGLGVLFATGVKLNSLAALDKLKKLNTLSLDKDVNLTPALLARQRAGTLTVIE